MKYVLHLCLPLALLASCAANACAQDARDLVDLARRRLMEMEVIEAQRQRGVISDQFDQIIFQQDGNATATRNRLDRVLAAQVDEIHQTCKLSDLQKKKLLLAGRGDIRRFFNHFEGLKSKWGLALNNGENHLAMHDDIRPLQASLRDGLFHEDSLLHKALPNTLTTEQLARHEELARERSANRHLGSIERAIRVLEQGGKPFSEAQRQEILTFLMKETKPARRANQYDYYRLLIHLGRLPREKQEELFGKERIRDVLVRLLQYTAAEARLRQLGHLPPEEDDGT